MKQKKIALFILSFVLLFMILFFFLSGHNWKGSVKDKDLGEISLQNRCQENSLQNTCFALKCKKETPKDSTNSGTKMGMMIEQQIMRGKDGIVEVRKGRKNFGVHTIPKEWEIYFDRIQEPFQNCLLSSRPQFVSNSLKKGIFFVTLESRKLKPETIRSISSIKCYCKIHGYDFMTQIIEDSNKEHNKNIILETVMDLLDEYQFVIVLDKDHIVANYRRPLEQFLDEKYDIFFHLGENSEIATQFTIWRSSSFARCYLKLFLNYNILKRESIGCIEEFTAWMYDKEEDEPISHKIRQLRKNKPNSKIAFKEFGNNLKRMIDSNFPIKFFHLQKVLWKNMENLDHTNANKESSNAALFWYGYKNRIDVINCENIAKVISTHS